MKDIERGWAAEINVTPLIDVLLVLLVIFMLIPHRNIFVPVNVPPEHGTSGKQLPKAELERRLGEIYAERPQKLLFLRVLGTWRYGEVIEVADMARGAGVQVIGYVPPK
jgi:biopolymer transport protein ExbD